MKNSLKTISLLSILGIGLFVTASCKKNDSLPAKDALDIALEDSRFSTFTKLLTDNGLLATLKSGESSTIFAPTNEAFQKADLSKLTKSELLKLLNTHIVRNNRLLVNEIKSGVVKSPNVEIYLSKNASGVFINGGAKVVSADILAANSVIQVIDQVVFPATRSLLEIIKNNPNFSELGSWIAVAENRLQDNISSATVSGFTIFAPSNAAFEELYKTTPKATLLADKKTLNEILRLHIIGGRVFSTDFPNITQPINTGNAPAITLGTPLATDTGNIVIIDSFKGQYQLVIDLTNGTKIRGISSGVANITTTNLLATNGVIHAIDKVLLP